MSNPITFHAEMMGGIVYLHQALQQPDTVESVRVVIKEVNSHIENHYSELVRQDQVPHNFEIVPSVWAMQCRLNLTTSALTK